MIAETATTRLTQVSPAAEPDHPDVRLRRALEAMRRELPTFRTVVIGDANGLPIASVGHPGGKEVDLGLATTAMATLTLQSAEKVTSSLGLPRPEDVWVRAGTSSVVVRALGHGVSLCAVLAGEVNEGLANLVLERVSRELVSILRELL